MTRQSGLGRGLASLIPQRKKTLSMENEKSINYFGIDGDSDNLKDEKLKNRRQPIIKEGSGGFLMENESISLRSILEIPVNEITPNPYQPRKSFDDSKLTELADSIKKHGILQPLVLSYKNEGGYELIAGERRLEASKIAGLDKVPAIIRKPGKQEKLELALVENIQRHNLNVIEEARAYKKLQEEFGLTQEQIAQQVGKNRSTVANIMRLLFLPIEIQRAVIESKISEGHARILLAISSPEKQRALFEMILKDNLTVRQIEEKVKEVNVSNHQRRVGPIDQELKRREEELISALGTKVKIKKGKKGGQLLIDFYSQEELDSIFDKLTK